MKHISITILAGLLLSAASLLAEDLTITSFSSNGELTWTFPTNGVSEYRIEWSSDLENGQWSDLENGMSGIVLTGATMTAEVPMFYRVKAIGASPTNMIYIPAGRFYMGNCMDPSEGNANELPVHRVYVNAFYMDRFSTTKKLWDDVYIWATNNGYTFTTPGAGDSPTNPVTTVNWYSCVKWANARSEMEGLTPCYYMNSETTQVYRTGEFSISNNCVIWDVDGYRLPTEAEWEKASRGGASGYRFSWADNTISHGRANYTSHAETSYDLSGGGHHPDY
ncbi:unnamed protein product, partial [marine sediment metagenome]